MSYWPQNLFLSKTCLTFSMSPFNFIVSQKKNLIRFLQKLVQTPSQNGADSLEPIAKTVSHELEKFGFKPILIRPRKQPSVLCFCNKIKKGRKLWLDAPLDTVMIGDRSLWKYPPFSGKIVKGKLFGRGSGDSKAAIAIFVYTAAAVFQSKEKIKGQLILTFDSGEQSGEFIGMKQILRKRIKTDACIIGYPGTDEIAIGARGFLRLNITTFGKSAHTGARYKVGINAISKMTKILRNLERLKMKYKKSPFFQFGPQLTIAQIEGGQAINIVPNKCNIKVDIRLVPSQTKNTVINDLKNLLKKLKKDDPQLRVELKPYLYQPPFFTPQNSEIVKILKINAQKILNKRIKLIASGASNVGNIIGNMGIPTICGFGVDGDNFHSENEFILIDSVLPVAKVYIKTILDFLGK